MASILVYIEHNDGYIFDCTLKAINIAREIASQKGAVLYGILTTNKDDLQNQQVTSVLSTFKLDKLIIIRGEVFDGPGRFETASHLYSFIKKLNPLLILSGDSPFAREYSSWIAGKLNGTFISDFLLSNYSKLVFKEEYPYSNQVFEIGEAYIEKPVVAIVKQSDFDNSAKLTPMEVKVENVNKKSQIRFENKVFQHFRVFDTILIIGTKNPPDNIKKIKEIASVNEWFIASVLPNTSEFKSILEIPISGFTNRFILWGCSAEETLLTSFCWSFSSKVLFVNSDYSNVICPQNSISWEEKIDDLIAFFETEIF